MVVPRLQKDGGIINPISKGFGGAPLGDRAHVNRVQTMPVPDFDSTKSNAEKMLTQ